MSLDRWIAIFFMIISLVYGYASYNYPLLPFERNMSFLPNTMPIALSVIGILLSGIIIFLPKKKQSEDEDALGNADENKWHHYKIGQAIAMIVAMLIYAVSLRPLGFLGATIFFLIACSWILGERKILTMAIASIVGSGVIWFLVQEVLGIFLKPLPWFFGS